MTIESAQNKRIKKVLKLRRQRTRNQQRETIVEGFRAVRRAVENGYPLAELYVCPALFLGENEAELIQQVEDTGTRVIDVAEIPFRKMAYVERPDGLLAVAPQVRAQLRDHDAFGKGFYIIAESIERPGNLGAIMRSADAAGVDGMIVCEAHTDIFNPEVIRASVGTIFTVPILEAATDEAIFWCRENGIRILATTPQAKGLYTDVDMHSPLAIVVGTEKYGLSKIWLDSADLQVKIPMFGQADSLNVATATTLLLYEIVRQRRGSLF
jgi:TrmH family RNA methyltransferase